MNKKRLVLVGVAAILALGIALCIAAQYKRQENTTKMLASIHELDDVLNFAEHKGTDYAADELLYLHTRSYTKDDLHLKWGEPNKSNADSNEDIWLLSDEYQLVIGYGNREAVWSIRVLSNLQNTDTKLYDANSLSEQDLISVFAEVREPEWEYVDCAIFPDLAYGQIGAALFWDNKKETSSVAFFDEDGCFQQCGTHARMAENPDFTYLGNGKVTYQMQTDAGEIYTYLLAISIDGNGVHFVAEDNLAPTELPGVYDINHNGEPDVFTLTWDRTSLTGSGHWTLSLLENNSEIWCDYAGLDHAGANTVFAVKIDGEDYLLRYSPDMGQGIADYWYEIFSLDENGVETLWKRNELEFDLNFGSVNHRRFDPEEIARFLQEVHSWLNDDSELLFSTEDGVFCSGGSGVSFRGDKFWSDTEYNPEKSLEENLRIYAERLTKLRAEEGEYQQ